MFRSRIGRNVLYFAYVIGIGLIVLGHELLVSEANHDGHMRIATAPNPVTHDSQEYDAASLILNADRLRRTTIVVKGVVMCQSTHVCILVPPWPMQDMISIGLEGLPFSAQKHIILSIPKDSCPEQLTGFFDGVHLEVTAVKFSSNPQCINGPVGHSETTPVLTQSP